MGDKLPKVVDAVDGMRPFRIQAAVCEQWQCGQVVGGHLHVPLLVQAAVDKLLEGGQQGGGVVPNGIHQQVATPAQLAVLKELDQDVLDAAQLERKEAERGRGQFQLPVLSRAIGQRVVLADDAVQRNQLQRDKALGEDARREDPQLGSDFLGREGGREIEDGKTTVIN